MGEARKFRTKLVDRKDRVRNYTMEVRVFLEQNESKRILRDLHDAGGMRAVIAHVCSNATPDMKEKIRERLIDEETLSTMLERQKQKNRRK